MVVRYAFIAICLVALGGVAHADPCAWVAPKQGPSLKPLKGVAMFTWRVDRTWFKCAKKAGGSLTLEYLMGAKGKLKVVKTQKIRGPNMHVGLFRSQYCKAKPRTEQVQVRLRGTGAMKRLSWTSGTVAVFCPRCPGFRSYMTRLGLGWNAHPHEKNFTVNIAWDDKWARCARKGSKVELRFFVGDSRKEVKKATKPVFVLKKLERRAKQKKKFRKKLLCKYEKAFVGFEFHATGEMQRLSGARSIKQIACPNLNVVHLRSK